MVAAGWGLAAYKRRVLQQGVCSMGFMCSHFCNRWLLVCFVFAQEEEGATIDRIPQYVIYVVCKVIFRRSGLHDNGVWI